jgi:integrase/recombinase XerD
MNDDEFQQVLSRVERNKSDSTASQYTSKIRKFRDWIQEQGKEFEEADSINVENWLDELDEYYSNASSVGKASAALVAAYDELNKLIEAGRIDGRGWVGDTPPQKATYTPNDTDTQKARESREDLHFLKPGQVDAIAKEAEKLRDELIIRLLFQTGIRVSELCEIRKKDVDTGERRINIRGKGRKNRTVYYQPSLDLLIDIWQDERRPAVFHAEDSSYLFPTSHSENITKYTVAEIVREAADEAGLQEVYGTNTKGVELHSVTPHVLRHSFAMAALSNDWDVYTLSQALGHESTEITTSTYLHDDADAVRTAYHDRGPVESADG